MAEIKQGILSAVKGKVGTVVGVMWRGKNIIRSRPTKSRKKPTEAQLAQWDKMSLVSAFSSKFKVFVNTYCPTVICGEKWMTGKEQMISRLMKQGIVQHEGIQYISIDQVLLSIGTLAPAVIKKINRLKTGKLKVQWDNSLINALTLDTDTLTLMAYNEELDEFLEISHVANRIDKYAHFSLPSTWNTGRIYFWSMWKSTDGSIHSTSCFHGVLDTELETIETVKDSAVKVINSPQSPDKSINTHTPQRSPSALEAELLTPTFELIANQENPCDKKKLKTKNWVPQGYIRRVNNQIIKKLESLDNNARTTTAEQQAHNEPRSILQVQKEDKCYKERDNLDH